jgi:phosphate transport system substrate-binding protein
LGVLLAHLVGFGAAALLVSLLERGPTPPFLERGASGERAVPAPSRISEPDVLHLAGSGSNLPLTRALAEAHAETGRVQLVVHESVGSRGGIRAVQDGVIHIGLVSRPLVSDEQDLGLVVTPYARSPVVVAVNASVPDEGVTSEELLDIYRGVKTNWGDGSRIVVLQREQGDSSHRAVERHLPELAAINDAAHREGRFRVLYDDAAMEEALMSTTGAIGLYGLGRVPSDLPIRALRVDGIAPTVADVRQGTYPFAKDLAFVTKEGPPELAADFLRFVFSAPGQLLIRERGYLPLGREAG